MGFATYKMRKISRVTDEEKHKSYIVLDDIIHFLIQMPPGTSLYSIKPLPVTSLALEYEITLYNNIFKDGAVIKDITNYTRSIGIKDGEDPGIKEYNKNPNFNFDDFVRQPGDYRIEGSK